MDGPVRGMPEGRHGRLSGMPLTFTCTPVIAEKRDAGIRGSLQSIAHCRISNCWPVPDAAQLSPGSAGRDDCETGCMVSAADRRARNLSRAQFETAKSFNAEPAGHGTRVRAVACRLGVKRSIGSVLLCSSLGYVQVIGQRVSRVLLPTPYVHPSPGIYRGLVDEFFNSFVDNDCCLLCRVWPSKRRAGPRR